jgi:hypothetical protein
MGCPCRGAAKEWAHVYPDGVNKFRTEVEAKASFYRMGEIGAVLPVEQVEEYLRQQNAVV